MMNRALRFSSNILNEVCLMKKWWFNILWFAMKIIRNGKMLFQGIGIKTQLQTKYLYFALDFCWILNLGNVFLSDSHSGHEGGLGGEASQETTDNNRNLEFSTLLLTLQIEQ